MVGDIKLPKISPLFISYIAVDKQHFIHSPVQASPLRICPPVGWEQITTGLTCLANYRGYNNDMVPRPI
jgi:hypothetical protein